MSNCVRALQTIDWPHAEPMLRSIVWGLLAFNNGQDEDSFTAKNPVYATYTERARHAAARLPDDWDNEKRDAGVTREV